MFGWKAAYAIGRECERRQRWSQAAALYKFANKYAIDSNSKVHYRLGYVHFKMNHLDLAIEHTEAATNQQPTNALWQYKLGFYHERNKDHAKAIEFYDASLSIIPTDSHVCYRLYNCHSRLNNREKARYFLKLAIANDRANKKYLQILADNLNRSGPLWQELELLESYAVQFGDDIEWTTRLAKATARLSKSRESAEYYARVAILNPANSDAHYNEGYQWQILGNEERALGSYSNAIKSDTSLRSNEFGIGALHQAHQHWEEAANSYRELLRSDRDNSELWYRLGYALDNCYEWEEAGEAYLAAVGQEPANSNWHFRLGLTLERSKKWAAAAESYSFAASLNGEKPEWYYRAGYCLSAGDEMEAACKAFLKAIPDGFDNVSTFADSADGTQQTCALPSIAKDLDTNPTVQRNAAMLRSLGESSASVEKWAEAAGFFTQAIRNVDEHSPELYYLLGKAQYMNGQYQRSIDSFKLSRTSIYPDSIGLPKYGTNSAIGHSMAFVELLETVSIDENLILWETNHGASIGCHPLAIFRTMVNDARYDKFQHIWAVNDTNTIPPDVAQNKNVTFVSVHSYAYKKALASSHYVINNVSFPPYYVRRPDQEYLNTWHGTPFKTLGKDMRGPVLQHTNIARNFLQSTHIMSPNEHTSWALVDRHDILGLFTGKIEITGSPRLDRMIIMGQDLKIHLRRRLGIDSYDTKPIVFYAPTWRGQTNDRSVDISTLKSDLLAMSSSDHHLVFRAHRLTERLLDGIDLPVTIVPADLDTSDLLAAVDVLVTDYSSVSFDFLPRRRPIIYFVPDLADYKSDRGLYLEPEQMPGIFCESHSILSNELKIATSSSYSVGNGYDRFIAAYSPLEDGSASQRVIDFFFEDAGDARLETKKPVFLFHQSLIPNGIATSFQNLMNSIDPRDYHLVLVVEPDVLSKDAGRTAKLLELPDYVQVIGRAGVYATLPEERYLNGRRGTMHRLTNVEQFETYMAGYSREFRRIFGPKKFDAHIEFDGYSPTWVSLMSVGDDNTKRLVYLHNDMMQEWKIKYPDLEDVFRLYPRFDKYVSVSESVGSVNSSGISKALNMDSADFDFCDNQINPKLVVSKSEEPICPDIQSWYARASRNIIAIGRMSPEKDHEKLIHAFFAYHTVVPDSNLIIIGDGPLREDLEHLILSLDASGYIWLAGQRANPYPALRASTAFVLSSLHEGQPMVLFEAMILGKRIICTDLPGPSSMLTPGYGLVVANSVEGLVEGFRKLDDQDFPQLTFDSDHYMNLSRNKFLSMVSP